VESGVGSYVHCLTENTLSFLGSFFLIAALTRFENTVQHNIGVCMGHYRKFFSLVGVKGEELLLINLIFYCGHPVV
jgi:hypothetical protein